MRSRNDEGPGGEPACTADEAWLRAALEAARVGIWSWDRATGRVVASRLVAAICGLEPSPSAVSHDRYRALVHPDDRSRVEAAVAAALAAGRDGEVEHRIVRPDGEVRWVRARGRAFLDDAGRPAGLRGIVLDVTEDKRLWRRLARMRFSVDKAADAIFWTRRDAGFCYVNERACASLGYGRDELLRLRVFDVDPEFTPEGWPAFWERLRREGSVIRASTHRRKDGTTFPVELNLTYFEFDGEELVHACVRDLTERRRAEEERRRLEARIRESETLESLGALAGAVAHDFNNLLVGILGQASLGLAGLEADAPARRRFEAIEQAASRAAALARQMLAYSGRGRFETRRVDLGAVVDEIVAACRPTLAEGVVIERRRRGAGPIVDADAEQLRQLVGELLANATEALDGAGRILVETRLAELDEASLARGSGRDELRPGRYAILDVVDTGRGIASVDADRIFEPFFTTKVGSRGLGLSAALGIVRGHGGRIVVDSEPGRGSRVRVLLPAATRIDAPSTGSIATEPGAAEPRARPLVLVADDEPTVRELAAETLAAAGFDVALAADGAEAVELFRRRPAAFAAVVLDLTMPRLGGREALEAMRRLRPELPCVLSSGYDMTDGDRPVRMAAFLRKPYRIDALLEAVRRAAGSGSREAASPGGRAAPSPRPGEGGPPAQRM